HRHAGRVRGHHVAELVRDGHLDGRGDGHARRRVTRLRHEQQLGGRGRRDVERGRGGAGEAAGSGRQRVAGAALVDRQGAEGGDAAGGGQGGGAAQRAAARVRADGHRHVGGVGGHQVVEGVEHAHGHRRANGHAGGGVGRLLPEGQVVGRGGRHVDRGVAGDAGSAGVGGGDRLAAGGGGGDARGG